MKHCVLAVSVVSLGLGLVGCGNGSPHDQRSQGVTDGQNTAAAPSPGQGTTAEPNPSQCDSVEANLINNCGFEAGCFMHWYRSDFDSSYMRVGADGAHSGQFGAFLGNPSPDAGYIGQKVATATDQRYDLSFWLRSTGEENTLTVSWDGHAVVDIVNRPAGPYTRIVAEGLVGSRDPTGTELFFWFVNQRGAFIIDDVQVVPE